MSIQGQWCVSRFSGARPGSGRASRLASVQRPHDNATQGEVAEWSNAAVLKTVVRLRGPGVRIPPSPETNSPPLAADMVYLQCFVSVPEIPNGTPPEQFEAGLSATYWLTLTATLSA